jgi:hypothetical protein
MKLPVRFAMTLIIVWSLAAQLPVRAAAPAALAIDGPALLPNAAISQPYSQTIVASGGAAPYSFSIATGALPAGLSLSSAGVISGTTSAPGAFSFVVKVTDQTAAVCEVPYTIVVLARGATPQISVTSDGRLGPASLYFYDNWGVRYYINTDNGVIYSQYSNYPWDAYPNQPVSRVVAQANGPEIRVLEFTTFEVNLGNSSLTIVGSKPLVIAAQGNISIRGTIRALNNGGLGGVRPEGNFDTGISGVKSPGSIVENSGVGGWGAAYVFGTPYTPWGWDILSAAGGGGGGGATVGATGGSAHTLFGAPLPLGSPAPGAAGAGGEASTGDVFQGGGGGGQGGYAHTWYCCYTGGTGANGGGALMFQSGGSVLIDANSAIVADGLPTPYYQGEVGAGGAGGGGYLLFDAAGTFENRGILSSRGGAGASYTSVMPGAPGAGGRVAIRAASATNSGIIDVSGGDESAILGGEFNPSNTTVTGGGQVKGIGSNVRIVPVEPADMTPPVLSLPQSLAFDASTTAGALVNFSATATDAVDGDVPVACTPQSGALFPIGMTTVVCSATDAHGNTANGSFAVTVRSAAEMASALAMQTAALRFDQGSQLLANVINAASGSSAGAQPLVSACNNLTAFANQVSAQSGKKLTAAQAAALIRGARQVSAALGCAVSAPIR